MMTPQQPEGPFYPVSDPAQISNDLTQRMGQSEKAEGEVLLLSGKVVDRNNKPIENALVEIWQACATGKYNHPDDDSLEELDPHFQYSGRDLTDKNGSYYFKTIMPGTYPAETGWIRPPHIHMKVHHHSSETLTTQVYFSGNKHNSNDRMLVSLSKEEQEEIVIDLKEHLDLKLGRFNIRLK